MKYTTVIFDAFDTIVHINRDKLPACQVNGETIRSTAPAVHAVYAAHFGKLGFDAFYAAFSQSFAQVNKLRRTELKEVRSQERFRLLLHMLGHTAEPIPPEILDSLTEAHMHELALAFEVRPETLEVLAWTAQRFRRAMISNFDHAPTLLAALDRFGIRSAFEAVAVSVEVGWRKPHRIIFEQTLEELGIKPAEALFIGDQLYVDVYGALNSGMDVVWIKTERQEWATPDLPPPTHSVRSIAEVIDLLEEKA